MTHPVVLLVGDDADTLDMYRAGLADEGFRAMVTGSSSRPPTDMLPNIVVRDVPTEDLTYRALEGVGTALRVPVVLLTTTSDAFVPLRAVRLGYAAVITKPCQPHALAALLRSIIDDE
jgi:DNA-binding response OmpR family regulator